MTQTTTISTSSISNTMSLQSVSSTIGAMPLPSMNLHGNFHNNFNMDWSHVQPYTTSLGPGSPTTAISPPYFPVSKSEQRKYSPIHNGGSSMSSIPNSGQGDAESLGEEVRSFSIAHLRMKAKEHSASLNMAQP